MSMPPIAVIIVNYATPALTIAAVESVLKHAAHRVSVHVVDNASPGDDATLLQNAHTARHWGNRVSLYFQNDNLGFGGGNNIVLRQLASAQMPPEFVFLLNPDATLDNDAITVLAAFLTKTPRAGFAGAGIKKPDGTAVTAAFRFPSALGELNAQSNFGPFARVLRKWNVALPPDHPHAKVDWISGAAMMIRMDTLRDVGFFDEQFFLYYEEVDLMRQARLAGWESWFVPEGRVIHAEGAATGVKSAAPNRKRKPAYWYHSWQYYFRKNHGRFGALIAAMAYLFGTLTQHIIARLRGRAVQAPLSGFSDFWKFSVRPLLRAEKVTPSRKGAGKVNR